MSFQFFPQESDQPSRKQGDQGGIIDTEGAIYASKVALYCPKCEKGVRIRNTVGKDGKKVRVCAKCGYEF